MLNCLSKLILALMAICCCESSYAGYGIDVYNDSLLDDNQELPVSIIYSDNFGAVPKSEKIVRPMLLRNQRLSPHTATIRTVAENVPTEVLTCLNYARSIWENMLSSDVSLVVNVNYESIDNDIETTVVYEKQSGVYVPTSQTNGSTDEKSVGTITINSDVDWDYAMADNIDTNKKNLTFALLRAFCRILGFGSSIIYNQASQQYHFFNKRGYSVFDYLIESSDDIPLTSIPLNGGRDNPAIADYLNQPNRSFFVGKETLKYKLANNTLSALSYIENGLMSANVAAGDYFLQVDDGTWDILKMIGWQFDVEKSVKIVPVDSNETEIPDTTGVFSAYQIHNFKLMSNSQLDLANVKWKFMVPFKNEGLKEISVGLSSSVFSIPEADLNADYEYDVDGLVECRLEAEGMIGNVPIKIPPYTVYWSFGPVINDVRITRISYSDDGHYFKAKYEVDCDGAEFIEIYSVGEYEPVTSIHRFREYKKYQGETDYIFKYGYAWLNVRAEQDGQVAEYTIEFAPDTQDWYPVESGEMIVHDKNGRLDMVSESENDVRIEVFDINGNLMFEGTDNVNLDDCRLISGVYIVVKKSHGNITTSKYLRQ